MKEYKFYDANLDLGTKQRMLNYISALFTVGGRLHDSFRLGDNRHKLNQTSIFTRISLPAGTEAKFETMTNITLKEPPKVRLN